MFFMSKKHLLKRLNPKFFAGIAHRGYWNEQFTENGLKAFSRAIENNLAFEYDIHLTNDGKLLVCHDEKLLRVTGKEGIIEELTLQEIRDNYHLLDGETLPTFEELLDLNHEQEPMVLELKVYKDNYKALAKAAMKVLKEKIKDHRNVWVISFDPRALLHIHGFVRALLVCKEHAWTMKLRFLFESLDIEDYFVKDPRVIRYRKHHPVNVWTIETPEQVKAVAPYVDTMTFQKLTYDVVQNALKK
jgi:glycerophosphoryl diester phosphodiesterase